MEATSENQEQPAPEAPSTLNVEDVDVDFLPIIYDIIRGLERDPLDTTQKTSGAPQDISQKVLDLHKKLEKAKEQVKQLPGVEYNKEQQLEKLEALRKQLRLKRELLLKYRTMFLMNEKLIERLSESYPIRRAAKWVVYFIQRSKTIQEDNIGKVAESNFKGLAEKIVKSLKDAKENLEKQAKK